MQRGAVYLGERAVSNVTSIDGTMGWGHSAVELIEAFSVGIAPCREGE